MSRTRETARQWALARGVKLWLWPLDTRAVSLDPNVPWVMLPDWPLHPAADALAWAFGERFAASAVSH